MKSVLEITWSTQLTLLEVICRTTFEKNFRLKIGPGLFLTLLSTLVFGSLRLREFEPYLSRMTFTLQNCKRWNVSNNKRLSSKMVNSLHMVTLFATCEN